jgi:cytochrome b pre-mRNA-processing protein 3
MFLAKIFRRKSDDRAVESAYRAIVAAARRPILYEEFAVADTLDGRFDMVTLHAFALMERLRASGEAAQAFSQELADRIFQEMDLSFREMGVGDLSVAKRVRKLAEIFYGRFAAYDAALRAGEAAFADALRRNVYPDGVAPEKLAALSHYAMDLRAALASHDMAQLMAGDVKFPEAKP